MSQGFNQGLGQEIILIYQGPGVKISESRFVGEWLSRFNDIKYTTPSTLVKDLMDPEYNVVSLCVPDGEKLEMIQGLAVYRHEIRRYVEHGGLYFGICAGAHMASPQMIINLESNQTLIQGLGSNQTLTQGLGLFPYDSQGLGPGSCDKSPKIRGKMTQCHETETKTIISTLDQRIYKSHKSHTWTWVLPKTYSKKYHRFLETGEHFDTEVLAVCKETSDPVILLHDLKKGKVLLSTLHLNDTLSQVPGVLESLLVKKDPGARTRYQGTRFCQNVVINGNKLCKL